MNTRVRRAEQQDARTLVQLICALAEFEQLDPPDTDAQHRFVRDGWPEEGSAPRFTGWLAEAQPAETEPWEAVGYAVTFFTYSSFLAQPTLYIEDIFVMPTHRRFAIGTTLIKALVEEAWNTGCGRMEWVVLDWNTGAQQFYRRLGAQHLTEWQYYRLRREDMPPLLASSPAVSQE